MLSLILFFSAFVITYSSDSKMFNTCGSECMKIVIIYQAIFRPLEAQGSEVCTLSKWDENNLAIWERKILRKMFVPVKENCVCEESAPIKSLRMCVENQILSQKGKIKMIRACGENIRRKNCQQRD